MTDDGAHREGDPELTAVVLRTLFSGASPAPIAEPYPLAVQTALAWQKIGVHATFAEVHGVTAGAARGRVSELIGRVASAGEQLGLAWTAEQDARSWLEPDRRRLGSDISARALAEIAGYYAIGAGHGLGNVTVRSLLLHTDAARVISNEYKRAKDFVPYDTNPKAWLPLNEAMASSLVDAAAVVAKPAVSHLAGLVLGLTHDPHWRALVSRRNIDFHRWRPQSVGGGVATDSPWEHTDTGESLLTMYATSRHRPLSADDVVQEASDGLTALAQAMDAWMSAWPQALRDLGVTVFKTARSDDSGRS